MAKRKLPACVGYGSCPADYMFVGISAGRLGALVTRVPFTKDASGRIFQRCLRRLGLSESDERSLKPKLRNTYVTNLVKSRVVTAKGLNRIPTPKEIEAGVPVFLKEIADVKPRLVFCLGVLVYERVRDLKLGGKPVVVRLNHPRWYQAHGALAEGSAAFERMVGDYRSAVIGGEHQI